ncbi:MAG: hypothetical protein GF320_07980 [Armatimonadia bacterium]|nr:hypothetical protein [Armatimonadia bacterium]
MAGTEGLTAQLELIHPDGHTLLDGPAEVVVTEERVEVQPERGAPLLIDVLTIREADVVADAVPLVLDSDYTVRLSELEHPEELLASIVALRRDRLSSTLTLPGRTASVSLVAEVSWSERGWVPLTDTGQVLADDTHLLVVPDHHQPLSVPLWGLDQVEAPPGGPVKVRSAFDDLAIEIADAGGEVDALAETVIEARDALRERIAQALPEGVPPAASEALCSRPCLRDTDPGVEGLDLRDLATRLAGEERAGAFRLLISVAEPEGLRLGVTVTPAVDEGEPTQLRAVSWCMTPCRSRGLTEGYVAAMGLSEAGECTVLLRRPDDSGDDDGPPPAYLAMERACADLAPHFEALGLPETELAEAAGGAWLWPMHQLQHLRAARKRRVHLISHADPGEWSRELLQVIARS